MTTHRATYSPEDNKIRIYPACRLGRADYDQLKAAGFAWAPKQEIFVAPMWTPGREDIARAMCGEIGDEDTTLAERAEDRAERFSDYRGKRADEAHSAQAGVHAIMGQFEPGQPIIIGHHSAARAQKDKERIEAGMRRAVDLWETSEYWRRRAAGALHHAKYKQAPDVRYRRIKGLEADQRKHQRSTDDAQTFARLWTRVSAMEWDRQTAGAQYVAGRTPAGVSGGRLYSAIVDGRMHGDTAHRLALAALAANIAHDARWLQHIANRLTYERAMLGESGGIAAEKFDLKPGGRVKTARGWLIVARVNKRDGRTLSVTVAGLSWTVGVEEITDYDPPTSEAARAVEKVAKIPPLCNYDGGEKFARMTEAQFKGLSEGARLIRRMPEAGDMGAHRVRHIAGYMSQEFGGPAAPSWQLVPVFLTDAKVKHAPEAKPAETQAARAVLAQATAPDTQDIRDECQRLADRREARNEREQQAAPFVAMREALRTGQAVQAVSAPQLFPTPADIAARMAQMAGLRDGMRVIEPSAGTGALMRAAADEAPGVILEAWEVVPKLADALRVQFPGAIVRPFDFLEFDPNPQHLADVVLMNPPFANAADVRHILHARKFLKPGGQLVAICAAGPRQHEALRDLSDSWEYLPAGTFAGTGVRTVLLTMSAPDDGDRKPGSDAADETAEPIADAAPALPAAPTAAAADADALADAPTAHAEPSDPPYTSTGPQSHPPHTPMSATDDQAAAQAIRDAWGAQPRTLRHWHAITATLADGRSASFLVRQERLSHIGRPALHILTVREGRMIAGQPAQRLTHQYRLTGAGKLVPAGMPMPTTADQEAAWSAAWASVGAADHPPHASTGPDAAPSEPAQATEHPTPTADAEPQPTGERFRVFGRTYSVIATFTDDDAGTDQANAYMTAHPGTGLLAADAGRLILASLADKGEPARFEPTPTDPPADAAPRPADDAPTDQAPASATAHPRHTSTGPTLEESRRGPVDEPETAGMAPRCTSTGPDDIGQRIADAIASGVRLTAGDQAEIRRQHERAQRHARKARQTCASSADPMRKGNAFPLGVGFTKMTKRAAQRIDASVRRAGESIQHRKTAQAAASKVDAMLSGKGTSADMRASAERIRADRIQTARRVLRLKPGDTFIGCEVVKINRTRDSYPSSIKVAGKHIQAGINDLIDLRRVLGSSGDALRAAFDQARADGDQAGSAAPQPTEPAQATDATAPTFHDRADPRHTPMSDIPPHTSTAAEVTQDPPHTSTPNALTQTFAQWIKAQWQATPYRRAYLDDEAGNLKRAMLACAAGGAPVESIARARYWRELIEAPRDACLGLAVYQSLTDGQKTDARRHFFDLEDRLMAELMDALKTKPRAKGHVGGAVLRALPKLSDIGPTEAAGIEGHTPRHTSTGPLPPHTSTGSGSSQKPGLLGDELLWREQAAVAQFGQLGQFLGDGRGLTGDLGD